MICVISTILVWVSLVAAIEPIIADEGTSSECLSIDSPKDAVSCAYQYTGFKEYAEVDSSKAQVIATVTSVRDLQMPLFGDSTSNHRVWVVRLDSVYLDMPGWYPDWVQRHNPKSFIALIDSATGQLYAVYSYVCGDVELPVPEELTGQTDEWSAGLVVNPPPVGLLKALDAAVGSNPLKAKQIVAVCVLYKRLRPKPYPVWCILGRGIPLDAQHGN